MSADLLRRAATKLREHATAAKPGPWEVDHEDLYFILRSREPVPYTYQADIVEVHSPDATWADFDYFALMHPPVALALAEWLEAQAADIENAVAAWSRDTSYIDKHLGGVGAHTENMFRPSIAAARAILREPEVLA